MKFCAEFLREHPMVCIRGEFFTVDGPIGDEDEIRKQILDKIKPVLTSGLAKTARNLLNALRIECWSPPLPIQQDRIHFANGTLMLDGGFTEEKDYAFHTLTVNVVDENGAPVEGAINFSSNVLAKGVYFNASAASGYQITGGLEGFDSDEAAYTYFIAMDGDTTVTIEVAAGSASGEASGEAS